MDASREQAEALDDAEAWPALPLERWSETRDALHLWTQIVGKIRLRLAPPLNHWWHSALRVTPRGLTTGLVPWGSGAFELRFDLVRHRLIAETSWGSSAVLPLGRGSVADFQSELFHHLAQLDIHPRIRAIPDELEDRTPFAEDTRVRPYDAAAVAAFHRALVSTARVLEEFRGGFRGKSSPVLFYWGTFDLSLCRYSGNPAPPRPNANPILRESYSHEVFSCGFWTGGGIFPDAAFYAYAVPEPDGISEAPLAPDLAGYDALAHEFLLPYEAVRTSRSPRRALLRFLQSTYDATASLGRWNRERLEAARPAEPFEDEGESPFLSS